MFIKRKHRLVIGFSSFIIGMVFVLTLVGYNLYIKFKGDGSAANYGSSIYKLNAELFRKDIILSNVSVETDKHASRARLPFIKGSLKNNSNKTVSSVLVEVSFQKRDGSVLYKERIYPLGDKKLSSRAVSLFFGRGRTYNVLLPSEGISFRHSIGNCPNEIYEQFSNKTNFAKNSKNKITIVYSISGLDVI